MYKPEKPKRIKNKRYKVEVPYLANARTIIALIKDITSKGIPLDKITLDYEEIYDDLSIRFEYYAKETDEELALRTEKYKKELLDFKSWTGKNRHALEKKKQILEKQIKDIEKLIGTASEEGLE